MGNVKTINTDEQVFLVKFAWTINGGKFMTTDVGATIKAHDSGRGIEYIKVFDHQKNRFVKISKSDILKFHSWNTESLLTIKSHNFFKNVK